MPPNPVDSFSFPSPLFGDFFDVSEPSTTSPCICHAHLSWARASRPLNPNERTRDEMDSLAHTHAASRWKRSVPSYHLTLLSPSYAVLHKYNFHNDHQAANMPKHNHAIVIVKVSFNLKKRQTASGQINLATYSKMFECFCATAFLRRVRSLTCLIASVGVVMATVACCC